MFKKNIYNYFFLITIFLASIFIANLNFNKFEKNLFIGNKNFKHSAIYQEDAISYYFLTSDKIIKDKDDNKSFFSSGGEYINSFLYPRIIYTFNYLINGNEKIFNKKTNEIYFKNHKFFIYFQIIFFFLALIFFYSTISKIYEKKLSKIIFLIIFLNPILFQWHLSFLTESIFLSFLIILFSILLRAKNFIHFLFIGIFIGIMYMQRTIAILYPFIILIYIFLLNESKFKKILKFFSLFFGFSLILIFIGLHNYSRAGIFYFTPTQSMLDLNRYIEADVIKISEKITYLEARNKLTNYKLNIIKKNNFDMSDEIDRIKYSKIIQKESLKTFLKNKEITIKVLLKNYFHSLLLNPVQVYYSSKYQHWYEYKNSDEHRLWLKIRIVFTLLFFGFSFFGLIFSFKNIDIKNNVFIFLSCVYFFLTSCWLGNTRYFTPTVLFMSIYFSIFLNEMINKIRFKKMV